MATSYPRYIVTFGEGYRQLPAAVRSEISAFMLLNKVKKIPYQKIPYSNPHYAEVDHHKGRCYSLRYGTVEVYDEDVMMLLKLTLSELIIRTRKDWENLETFDIGPVPEDFFESVRKSVSADA